jgi:hypothetical protein
MASNSYVLGVGMTQFLKPRRIRECEGDYSGHYSESTTNFNPYIQILSSAMKQP